MRYLRAAWEPKRVVRQTHRDKGIQIPENIAFILNDYIKINVNTINL